MKKWVGTIAASDFEWVHGDQIGPFFAYLVVVYFGQFFLET
jgi:hypothetical protein